MVFPAPGRPAIRNGVATAPMTPAAEPDASRRSRQHRRPADARAGGGAGQAAREAPGVRPSPALPVADLSGAAVGDGAKPRNAREEVLCRLYAELLGVPEVGINSSFFDLGGHSLLAARLTFRLRKLFGENVAVGMVLANPSVSQLAAALDPEAGDAGGAAGADSVCAQVETADAELAGLITALGRPPATVAAEHLMDQVLLTGATGYLGTFLLHELLEGTRAHVWCLVRAADATQGLERLRENLARFDRSAPELNERVTVLIGDLSQPLLGLTEQEFERLGRTITAIYHNGASVNLVLPYDSVKGANLNSTRELLRLASASQAKPLHLISTDAIPRNVNGNGYLLSKEMAENVVRAAREQGYPSSIFRLPRLSLDSRTGLGNHRDAALRTLRMVMEVGAAPDLEFEEMWIPVDEAARLVVRTTLEDPDAGLYSVVTDEATAWSAVVRLCVESGLATVTSPAHWAELVRRGGSAENEVILRLNGLDERESEQDDEPDAPYGDPAAFGRVVTGPRVSDASLLAFLRGVRGSGEESA
jgi:thioester reductase-like protein